MDLVAQLTQLINENIGTGRTSLPVFNKIALKLQQELSKSEPDQHIIKKMISNDPSLTGQLLKVANSAYYKGMEDVTTVQEAIFRLGTAEVGNIVLLITQKSNFQSKDAYIQEIMNRLWKHSVGCAIGAKWVANKCGCSDLSNQAFTAGLLHDVGKLFILTVIDSLVLSGHEEIKAPLKTLNRIMAELHLVHGYSLMKIWALPEIYCEVVRDHHKEKIDSKNILLPIIKLVDMVCNKIGLGIAPDSGYVPEETGEAKILGLGDIDIAELEIKLEDAKFLF
ncbi:HDOD domain-containing protein [Desulforegula conservatrix]|uniref:HDOD domain-containing protein n=1 Tax=Desulforegula conservatrix TaxID=153026 RepID=UPI000417BB5E|nr:HDOD domain-containing protein [Desulforegula conservatrix]